jgi:hypothetical protein
MTAMAWQPEEEPLRQLSSCLKDSLSGHNKTAQKQAEIVSGFCQDPFVGAFLYYENSC